MDDYDLFMSPPADEDDLLDRLRAFLAPAANHTDSVVKDPALLDWAFAVYEAFGDLDVDGSGLTSAEIEAACGQAGPGTFESRFAVFKALGLVVNPIDDRSHQRKFVFTSTGVAALLVFERLRRGGGVQEILMLLEQTRTDVELGLLTRHEVEHRLQTLRRALVISTGELLQLRLRPVEDVVRGRRDHRSADRLLRDAKALILVVEERHPELSSAGGQLVTQALRYCAAANDLSDRLLRHARSRRDFSMLPAEHYQAAAYGLPMDALARVFADVVFDPPQLFIAPEHVLAAVDVRRPGERRRRPSRPLPRTGAPDPVAAGRARRRAARDARAAAVILHLAGRTEVDLTATVKAAGWPGAAQLVAELMAAAADQEVAFTIELAGTVDVDADARVSYVTPIRLVRRSEAEHDG